MSEFEAEVKKAEMELEQSLVPLNTGEKVTDDEFLGDIKMQAQEYGQKIQDAAVKARDFANEKFSQAGDKFKEISAKDPKGTGRGRQGVCPPKTGPDHPHLSRRRSHPRAADQAEIAGDGIDKCGAVRLIRTALFDKRSKGQGQRDYFPRSVLW
jgi:hypothetical protein